MAFSEAHHRRKNAIWSAIASKVTACGVAVRTDEEVRDKWKNVKSEVIRRINDQKKTGGGPPKKPLPYEELVTSIMGEQSPVIDGLRGKCDSLFHVCVGGANAFFRSDSKMTSQVINIFR